MAEKKSKCYNMDCKPVETGFNHLRIFVCRKCKMELTESCYNEEIARIKRNEEIAKKDSEKKTSSMTVETKEVVQDEFDLYMSSLGIDNTFLDWPTDK